MINIYILIIKLNSIYSKKRTFKIILFFLVVFELCLNIYDSQSIFTEIYDNKKTYTKVLNQCPYVKNNHRYIYDYVETKNRNYSLFCNTSGAEYSSSNINNNIKKFYQKIGGFVSGSHYYLTKDNTDLIKRILSIGYEQVDGGKYINIDNSLSIGYMVKDKYEDKNIENPFEYQNKLISKMIGENIKPLKSHSKLESSVKKNSIKEIYENNSKSNIYFYIWHDTKQITFPLNFAEVIINNSINIEYNGVNSNYGIRKINNIEDEKIVINITKIKNDRSKKYSNYYDINKNWLYYEDKDVVDYAISKLSKNQLNITKMEKNVLEGNVEVEENKILLLTIPYEKGWNIYIDGKKTDYFKTYDAFIGVDLTKGKHVIKMKFYPEGLNEGILVSIFTSLFIVIKSLIRRHKNKKGSELC